MSNSVLKALVLSVVLTFTVRQPAEGLAGQVWQHNQQGAQQEVNCPLETIRAEITSQLPDPWWNTPQVGGKLVGVSIEVIGGKRALVCWYPAYGTRLPVMRRYPEGVHECKPAENHFVCQ